MKLLRLLLILISLKANASTLTESFNSTTNMASSTLVWNFALGYLHPRLQIFSFQAPAQAASSSIFSVSDGSHGAFDVSTYANFGSVVGNNITIDANTFPVLKVSSFHLDNSYTLTVSGGPLIIHSLSTVKIDGTIQCHGDDGLPAVGATGGAGGIGRCGGFAGGRGGNAATSGTHGLPLTGSVAGGGGGIYNGAAPGAGGGGGGAYVGNDGGAGQNSIPATNTGGAGGAGSTGENHEFTILNGSPGGGGGSGSNTEGGGGGGGGGGTVVIHAVSGVTISATGAILAYGGNGGGANSGGGGGGGGGGSVKIFTAANLEFASGISVDVTEGSGAIPSVANAGDSGSGSFGRTWVNYSSFSGAGTESHGTLLVSGGTIAFVSGTAEVATSKSFDTQSELTTYESIMTSPISSDITLQVAGSNDNFASDDSGWLNSAAISTLNTKRYVKFRISLNNSNPMNPTIVDDVFMYYTSGTKENFNFAAGCGRVSTNVNSNGKNILLLTFLFALPLFLQRKLRKAKIARDQTRK